MHIKFKIYEIKRYASKLVELKGGKSKSTIIRTDFDILLSIVGHISKISKDIENLIITITKIKLIDFIDFQSSRVLTFFSWIRETFTKIDIFWNIKHVSIV